MALRLTQNALYYYILTCLSIQDMYGAQILKNVNSYVSINSSTLYLALDELEREKKIIRKSIVKNGVACELCRITRLGKKYLKSFLKD